MQFRLERIVCYVRRMMKASSQLRRFAEPASFVLLSILVYLPAINGAFLWDDPPLIRDNVLLRSAGGLWRIWTTVSSMPAEEHYWPLQYTFLWLEWHAFGNWTAGYHIVNMLLHGAVAIQIWRLMRRMAIPGAWLAGTIFVVHPVHAEVVAWIFSVKDLLATLLCLLVIEMFLIYRERGWKWLAGAALLIIAAMLIKSTATLLPVGLAILIWYRQGRLERRDWAGLAVLAAITFAMALVDIQIVRVNNVGRMLETPPFLNRLVQAGMAFGFYIGKLVWPAGLSPLYPQFGYQVGNLAHWLPLIATVLVSFVLWTARDRIGRGPLACWLFYGVMLGPALGIIYFGFLMKSPVADRYQYLPSIAPIVGVAALVASRLNKTQPRALLIVPVLAALIALSATTWRQARFYKDEIVFFRRGMEIAPESFVGYYNLGVQMWNAGNYPLAERLFAKAREFNPGFGEAIYNQGRAIERQGKIAEAVKFYRDEIAAGCVHPNVWGSLAWMLAVHPQVRDPQTALRVAKEANMRTAKPDPELLNALAAALAANGQFSDAAATARHALDLAKQNGAPETIQKIEDALPLYEQGKPYLVKQ